MIWNLRSENNKATVTQIIVNYSGSITIDENL